MQQHVCMHVLHKLSLVPSSPVETYWDQPSKNDFKWQAWWVICLLGLPVSGFLLSSVLITFSVITGFYPSLTSLVRDGERCLEKDLRTACVFCTFASSSPMIWPGGHLPTPSWGIPHGDQEKEEELHFQAAAAQGRALCQVKGTKQLFSHPHLWQGVTHCHWGWQVGTSSLQEEDGRNPWTIFKWRMQIPLFRLLDQVFLLSVNRWRDRKLRDN